jgi:hypothetical protein
LTVTDETSPAELVGAMCGALARAPRYATDRLWLPAWDIFGTGPVTALLADPQSRDSLLAELHQRHPVDGTHVVTQAVRLHGARGGDHTNGDDELASEFDRRLQERAAHAAWSLPRRLADSPLANGPWEGQLATLLDELDEGAVMQEARRIGHDWFAGGQERST